MSRASIARNDRVVITGWGLISPLGHSAWETFSRLCAGKTIADRAHPVPPDIGPVALVQALGSVAVARHTATDPLVELTERVAREATVMAGIKPGGLDCTIATSKGAMHALIGAVHGQRRRTALAPPPIADASLAIALGPHGYLSHHLQMRLGVHPLGQTVAACASGLTAVHDAHLKLTRWQRGGGPSRILVVSGEASLVPLFIHSYRRLGVLPPLTPDQYRGRPLDHRRNGFVLAELAGAVVLESVARPQPGQIELVDTATASDSYDLIRAAPGMPALSRVAQRLLAARQVDLLHPHATGTVDHDPAELAALAIWARSAPDLYACKGALGHGLGASGLVSLVVACMCAKAGCRPPMPWLDEPIDTVGLSLTRNPAPHPPRTHAVFGAGFGGHVAGAVIRQH